MVWKIFFCSEFPDISEKSSRRRRWGKQTNAKCFAFQANAINLWNNVLTFEKLKINDMQILLKYFEQFPNGRIFVNSPWIQHIEFPRQTFVDISSTMKSESTWKEWHRFGVDKSTSDFQNQQNINDFSTCFFSMEFQSRIDVTSNLTT